MSGIAIRMRVHGGKPAVTSLQVAESFGKNHRDVLRDIRQLLEPDEDGFGERNFALSSYLSNKIKKSPCIMTRDGFTLLVMGYTGAGSHAAGEEGLYRPVRGTAPPRP